MEFKLNEFSQNFLNKNVKIKRNFNEFINDTLKRVLFILVNTKKSFKSILR